jgi:hypothetical protein
MGNNPNPCVPQQSNIPELVRFHGHAPCHFKVYDPAGISISERCGCPGSELNRDPVDS